MFQIWFGMKTIRVNSQLSRLPPLKPLLWSTEGMCSWPLLLPCWKLRYNMSQMPLITDLTVWWSGFQKHSASTSSVLSDSSTNWDSFSLIKGCSDISSSKYGKHGVNMSLRAICGSLRPLSPVTLLTPCALQLSESLESRSSLCPRFSLVRLRGVWGWMCGGGVVLWRLAFSQTPSAQVQPRAERE